MLGHNFAAQTTNFILERTIDEFTRASNLIESLECRIYTLDFESRGSIGAHMRHNFDIASRFLSGLRTGKIDYTARKRQSRFEQDRRYAIARIKDLITVMGCIPNEMFGSSVAVRSEVDDQIWHNSSVARELEFVQSHTVHHHALVAEKLKACGVEVSYGFGVATSTLRFWADVNSQATVDKAAKDLSSVD